MTDGTDQEIIQAIGEELRRARANTGWSRPELVARLTTPTPVNTYACYEQGIRQCSIPRLVEICKALGVGAPGLLGRALLSLELDLADPKMREIRNRLAHVEAILDVGAHDKGDPTEENAHHG